MDSNNENIQFSIDFLPDEEIINNNTTNVDNINISSIKNECDDFVMFDYLNYTNNTVKELMLICEFYNIAKELKAKKANKETIINAIQIYENDDANYEMVAKRHNFWFYMNELKNDKFMKKFVLW
jgi:hypothetical protein